jgi:aryl-alcohol dehydrogenase-like predicted oxidoreductase
MHASNGLFSATKVWTGDGDAGPPRSRPPAALWRLPRFDLLQVHNLLAWEAHLETLQAMRERGRVRYIGVTTSHGRRHRELERIMATQPIDFVQLTYNVVDREAERRLLPLAARARHRRHRQSALPSRRSAGARRGQAAYRAGGGRSAARPGRRRC